MDLELLEEFLSQWQQIVTGGSLMTLCRAEWKSHWLPDVQTLIPAPAVQGFLLRPTKVSPYSLLITTRPPQPLPPHGLPCHHHDCHNSNTTTPRIGREGHVCTWSKFLGGFYNNYFFIFSVRMFTVLDQTRLWSMCQSKIFNPHGNNIWKYNISECKVQYVINLDTGHL